MFSFILFNYLGPFVPIKTEFSVLLLKEDKINKYVTFDAI